MSTPTRFVLCAALIALAPACEGDEGSPVDPTAADVAGGGGGLANPGEQVMVDETGFLVGSLFHYTAQTALSADATTLVSVIGLPGAIATEGGALSATNQDEGVDAAVAVVTGDGFLVQIDARLGDTIAIAYTVGEQTAGATITLSDDLGNLPPPMVQTGSGTSQQEFFELSANNASNVVSVYLGNLSGRSPGVVAYNEDSGDSAFVEPQFASVELAGGSGDTVCVFTAGASGNGTTLCDVVP